MVLFAGDFSSRSCYSASALTYSTETTKRIEEGVSSRRTPRTSTEEEARIE
jgi:hypothetical protein